MFQLANNMQKLELKKHVNAIHCTNNLSLLQRKLFNALLFNAYNDLPNKTQFEIPARKLCNIIGYNSNDYGKLKVALLGLLSITIQWNVIDYTSAQTGKWNASTAIAAATLENGICTYEYSSIMRELLYRPEIYGRLSMEVLSKFKSSYGIALYENCMRYQGLPQTPWFALDVFRKLMGVHDDKYLTFKDFKKRVLTIAEKEVNEHSQYKIISEVKRVNQKVSSIRFKFTTDTNLPLEKNFDHHDADDSIIDILTNDFNFSPETIKEIMLKYDYSYIQEKVNMILNSDSFKTGKIKVLGGYLIEALKNNYRSNKPTQPQMSLRKVKIDPSLMPKEEKCEEQKKNYYQYLNGKINTYITSLSNDDLSNLKSEFEQSMKNNNNVFLGKYYKHGLEYMPVKACYIDFIIKNKISELDQVLSYEEFIKLHNDNLSS